MKKAIKKIFPCTIALILVLSGCYKEDISTLYSRQVVIAEKIKGLNDKVININTEIQNLHNIYNTLEQRKGVSTIIYIPDETNPMGAKIVFTDGSELYIPFGTKGEKGDTPHIGPNGNWFIGNTDTGTAARGRDGKDGKDGKDGQSPHIGSNGNWYIGNSDTGIKAKGEDGEDGNAPYIGTNGNWYINGQDLGIQAKGQDGKDGKDGKTPYVGSNGNWFIDGQDLGIKAKGQDGEDGASPYVGPNGNWFIDGQDLGIKAKGEDGKDGKTPYVGSNGNWFIDGQDLGIQAKGADGCSPHIGSNGNWYIGSDDTGIQAKGQDGADGTDGKSPYIGSNGNWYIDGQDLGIQAKGKDGMDGHSPVITISDDGHWVIDGSKTTHKVTGDAGKTPIISAMQDPNTPSDPNFYWTVKFGDEAPQFIMVGGQKLKANPEKGEKGDKGDPGATGPQGEPGTEPYIANITQDNEGNIIFTTTGGKIYTVPRSNVITFKILPEARTPNTSTFEPNTKNLIFENPNEAISMAYQSSDNLKTIRYVAPNGWSIEPDLTNKMLKINPPSYNNLARAAYMGDIVFYALDEKGQAVTDFLHVTLKKKAYLSYFYNENKSTITRRADSKFNEFNLNDLKNGVDYVYPYTYQNFLFDIDNQIIAKDKKDLRTQAEKDLITKHYPSTQIFKFDDWVEKEYTLLSAFYRPDSVDLIVVNGQDNDPSKYGFRPRETSSGSGVYTPIPYNTYFSLDPLTFNNGSDIFPIRLYNATATVNITLGKFFEISGIDEASFDIKKLTIEFNNSPEAITFSTRTYGGPKTLVADYKYFTLIKDGSGDPKAEGVNNIFKAKFNTIGCLSSTYNFLFKYDGQEKLKIYLDRGYADFDIGQDIYITYNYKNNYFKQHSKETQFFCKRDRSTGKTVGFSIYMNKKVDDHWKGA